MLTWKLHKKEFDLSFQWKISRGATTRKTLYFVEVGDHKHQAFGEISSITQSTQTPIEQAFQLFIENNEPNLPNIQSSSLPSEIKFGMSSALTHFECLKNNEPLWQRLKLPSPTKVQTSFSIPIMETSDIPNFFQKYQLSRFKFIKVKITHSDFLNTLNTIAKHTTAALRIDANEAFHKKNDVFKFFKQIEHLNVDFIEQPMPSQMNEVMSEVKKKAPFRLIADESLQSSLPSEDIRRGFHGINIKLMKAGGYQSAIEQINWAKENDMKTMVGCMVETSLGIYGAMTLSSLVDYCDLDGFLFFQKEPFGLLKEESGSISIRKDLNSVIARI